MSDGVVKVTGENKQEVLDYLEKHGMTEHAGELIYRYCLAFEFAGWVAREIFYDDNYDADGVFNFDAFAEIACRKLNKMGIVKADNDNENWLLASDEEVGED